ncbi:MAG: TRL-like protein family [SAR324 cluster bacterium]|nr:TRL-like protein family [SAR324 cluster bacterium]
MLNKKCFLIYFVAIILSGCAYQSPVPGAFYTGTTFPSGDKVKLDGKTANKQGKSTCTSIFALVAFGDCSIKSAMKDGGITKIHHVDSSSMNVLYFFFRYETIVYGE